MNAVEMEPSNLGSDLQGFRRRFEDQPFEEAFDCMASFARVVAAMPAHIASIRSRDIPVEQKEKEIREIMDLMTRVYADEMRKFNAKILQAKAVRRAA